MTLEERLNLVRWSRPDDDLGRLGFMEGAKFCLEHRNTWTLVEFKQHYDDMKRELIHKDSYEESLLFALKCNIQELEGLK